MKSHTINQDEVVERSKLLPAFPLVITQILATLENPDANFNTIIGYVERDPVISSRVLSLANKVATRTRNQREVKDIPTATTLIGLMSVRDITLTSSFASFCGDNDRAHLNFLKHSISTGVACDELARYTDQSSAPESTLVSGLLHDIGQFWLACFKKADFSHICDKAYANSTGIDQVEHDVLGVDHSMIGYWLATHWGLPQEVCNAIRYHHNPDACAQEPLVALVHVAEILSNALELSEHHGNQVTRISAQACKQLGLSWNAESRQLFGRIEARSRHANSFLK